MKIHVLLLVVVTVCLAKANVEKSTPAFNARKFKRNIITAHRNYRDGEPATDMKAMKYDNTMASFAQQWVDRCEWEHGHVDGEKDAMGTYVGQNLWMSSGTNPTDVGKKVSSSWFNEKKNYDIKNHKCAPGTMCGHYTQIVWASTTKVGCGFKLCECKTGKLGDFACRKADSKPYSWMFVACHYAPGGNYQGARPYTVAE